MIEDYAYIGMGSTINDNSVIESYAVIAAGAVVEPGAKVPSGQIWAGSPAKYLRDVTPEERDAISEYHSEMKNLAAIHSEETEKNFEQVFNDQHMKERSYYMTWTENLYERLQALNYIDHPIDHVDIERVKGTEYVKLYDRYVTELYTPKTWRPFKEDSSVFPEDWKIYGEDLESYERAKKIFDQPPKPRDDTGIPLIPKDQTPWTRRY